jgi:hypothetical protein
LVEKVVDQRVGGVVVGNRVPENVGLLVRRLLLGLVSDVGRRRLDQLEVEDRRLLESILRITSRPLVVDKT